MENQSPILQRLNNKEEIFKKIKDNLNYIYIALMIIVNCLISLLKIEDGQAQLRYPKDGLSWVLWATQILSITSIGVMILNAFRRQGVKNGHTVIKETYDDYLKCIQSHTKGSMPRSLKQYMTSNILRDSITKGGSLIIVNLLVLSVTISANLNSLLSLITNIIFSICFGLKAMLEAEDFVVSELVVWYKLKIEELSKENNNVEI